MPFCWVATNLQYEAQLLAEPTHPAVVDKRLLPLPALYPVAYRASGSANWEVWQHSYQSESCWGHLHKNLLTPYQGIGNGPSKLIQQWMDEEALSITKKIESSPHSYPFINKYRYWPGPNSNTFAQWIVGEKVKLGSRAIGKNFPVPDIHQIT